MLYCTVKPQNETVAHSKTNSSLFQPQLVSGCTVSCILSFSCRWEKSAHLVPRNSTSLYGSQVCLIPKTVVTLTFGMYHLPYTESFSAAPLPCPVPSPLLWKQCVIGIFVVLEKKQEGILWQKSFLDRWSHLSLTPTSTPTPVPGLKRGKELTIILTLNLPWR